MRHPTLPTFLCLSVLLGAWIPATSAMPATPAPPQAQSLADDAKTAALAHLAEVMVDRIACKPKSTVQLRLKDGKFSQVALNELNLAGATYTPAKGDPEKITWFDLGNAADATQLFNNTVDSKNSGENLFAARVLLNLKGGAAVADRYLNKAGTIDKQLAGKQAAWVKAALTDLATADYNHNRPEWAWPRLNAKQQAEAIEKLDADAQNRARKAGLRFISDQSEHFIFYTDSDLGTARMWAGKLEGAYARLCKTFDLDPRQNVWQGKCAVVLCRDHASYAKWMGVVAPGNRMAAQSAGLSTSGSAFFGSNAIHFYHNPADIAYTQSVLIHELAHAFTAQFHGNHYLHSWINEGLADYIASDGQGFAFKTQESRELIRKVGAMDDFFAAKNINFKHYGAACDIAMLLIKKNAHDYGRFVKAVTEGQEPDAALKTHCGLTIEQLTAGYGRTIGVPKLRSH